MERVVEELDCLASHWDERGIPPLSDVTARDDQHKPTSSHDSSRQH